MSDPTDKVVDLATATLFAVASVGPTPITVDSLAFANGCDVTDVTRVLQLVSYRCIAAEVPNLANAATLVDGASVDLEELRDRLHTWAMLAPGDDPHLVSLADYGLVDP